LIKSSYQVLYSFIIDFDHTPPSKTTKLSYIKSMNVYMKLQGLLVCAWMSMLKISSTCEEQGWWNLKDNRNLQNARTWLSPTYSLCASGTGQEDALGGGGVHPSKSSPPPFFFTISGTSDWIFLHHMGDSLASPPLALLLLNLHNQAPLHVVKDLVLLHQVQIWTCEGKSAKNESWCGRGRRLDHFFCDIIISAQCWNCPYLIFWQEAGVQEEWTSWPWYLSSEWSDGWKLSKRSWASGWCAGGCSSLGPGGEVPERGEHGGQLITALGTEHPPSEFGHLSWAVSEGGGGRNVYNSPYLRKGGCGKMSCVLEMFKM